MDVLKAISVDKIVSRTEESLGKRWSKFLFHFSFTKFSSHVWSYFIFIFGDANTKTPKEKLFVSLIEIVMEREKELFQQRLFNRVINKRQKEIDF